MADMMNDPMIMQYLLEQGLLNSQGEDIDRQAEMAKQLRQQYAKPTGFAPHEIGSQFYVPPNPLEMMASQLGQSAASNREAQTRAGHRGLNQRRQEALARLAASAGGRAPPPMGTVLNPPPQDMSGDYTGSA